MNGSNHIWMQLLGFEKNDADCGAARFLEQTGFVPSSVCALLFHPDFIHLHRGMQQRCELLPDNCAYRAIPRNTERERQAWTNHELRTLIAGLKAKGVEFYAGIMGTYLQDTFHHEWLSDHPELRATSVRGPRNLMCLKRFADGRYYEDYFAEQLVRVLLDYDCAGVHLSDGFCPSEHLYKSDYSTDMVSQFTDHTGEKLPPEVAATMGDDSPAGATARRDYLWGSRRAAWIGFWEWRWARFFEKVCAAVHAVGKKVWILGMYCSDPFETRYVYGFDTARVMAAGVDCITANVLPSSVYLESPKYPYYFHRMHMDLPLLRTQVGEHAVLSMINVHDASEEWSVLEHTPVRLERDIYTAGAFTTLDARGVRRATDGLFYCLGDGLTRRNWEFLKKRADIAQGAPPACSLSPMVLWSDAANEKMLGEYITTRRTTPHKQSFEIFKAGTPLGGALRSEFLQEASCPLFVPNFDMLDEQERRALAAYPYPVVGTAPANYPLLDLTPTYVCQDWYSDYSLKAFVCNMEVSATLRAEIDELLAEDNGDPSRAGEPESEVHPPVQELPFVKLTQGFVRALAALLRDATEQQTGLQSSCPMLVQRLVNGNERLYLYNPYDNGYTSAKVTSSTPVEQAEVVSAYPILPVKFFHKENISGVFDFQAPPDKMRFQVKLAPEGVTVVEIQRAPTAKH